MSLRKKVSALLLLAGALVFESALHANVPGYSCVEKCLTQENTCINNGTSDCLAANLGGSCIQNKTQQCEQNEELCSQMCGGF